MWFLRHVVPVLSVMIRPARVIPPGCQHECLTPPLYYRRSHGSTSVPVLQTSDAQPASPGPLQSLLPAGAPPNSPVSTAPLASLRTPANKGALSHASANIVRCADPVGPSMLVLAL